MSSTRAPAARPATRGPAARLASERVHARLRRAILEGAIAPGDALPSERALAEAHGVNRHAVREAVKRLQEAGLVTVHHGGATRATDWRTTAGLDLLADLAGGLSGAAYDELLRSIAEMRRSIGADAARACAERAPEPVREALREAAAAQDHADIERYEALWALVLEGAGNLAYRLAFNALVAERVRAHVDPGVYADELADPAARAALATACAERDPDAARARAHALLSRTVDRLGSR